MLKLSDNPLLKPRPLTVAGAEREMQRRPHLAADRRLIVQGSRRDMKDVRKTASAIAAIGKLPAADEALHLVVCGRFSLWNCVPAVAALSGRRIVRLHVATLGFSKKNIEALCGMLDAGTIGTARLLCSHYFASTSEDIFRFAESELAKRRDRASFLSLRTHAKLVLLKLDDGRTVTIESSANLRSCVNIEQVTLIGSPEVYSFHAGWIDELFEAATDAR